MKAKSEALTTFQKFENDALAALGDSLDEIFSVSIRVGSVRTDNAGELTSASFEDYLRSKGIKHQLTVPHSSSQNGVAERALRSIQEIARDFSFWCSEDFLDRSSLYCCFYSQPCSNDC